MAGGWGTPGVTEELMLQETPITLPSEAGGPVTRTLQRAGLLRKLVFLFESEYDATASKTDPVRSALGPLGAGISNISIKANGQIPLLDISGLGMQFYNEIQNRDGSVISRPLAADMLDLAIVPMAEIAEYDTPVWKAGAGSAYAAFPFEFQMALPFAINQMVQELGLWLLQNQAIDVSITVNFNPTYAAVATNNALWSAGTGIVGASYFPACNLLIERHLYNIPSDTKDWPDLRWAHQVVEYQAPIVAGYARFDIPRAGLLLRAMNITLDDTGLPLNTGYFFLNSLDYVYGSNEKPISRPSWALEADYVNDYNRVPPAGVTVIDFYKEGENGLKLVKSTEDLANLRLEFHYANAALAGTQLVILDRLIPVQAR